MSNGVARLGTHKRVQALGSPYILLDTAKDTYQLAIPGTLPGSDEVGQYRYNFETLAWDFFAANMRGFAGWNYTQEAEGYTPEQAVAEYLPIVNAFRAPTAVTPGLVVKRARVKPAVDPVALQQARERRAVADQERLAHRAAVGQEGQATLAAIQSIILPLVERYKGKHVLGWLLTDLQSLEDLEDAWTPGSSKYAVELDKLHQYLKTLRAFRDKVAAGAPPTLATMYDKA